VGVVIY